MFRFLYPDEYSESIFGYDFAKAWQSGKRAVLFDIDNTLVPHGAPADEKSIALMGRLRKMGFALCAVSNNRGPRVKMFCDAAGTGYVCDAAKPSASGYTRALELLSGLSGSSICPGQALLFGDQIFTDIWGAKRAGIESVLVKPIDRGSDEIQIKLKRMLEKPIISGFFKEKGIAIADYFN